jgi:hypothetical protein
MVRREEGIPTRGGRRGSSGKGGGSERLGLEAFFRLAGVIYKKS